MGRAFSLNLSGYLYDRRFYDWDEERLGGRLGLGYRLTPDLSLSVGVRGEQVDISDPRVLGVPNWTGRWARATSTWDRSR